MRVYERRPSGLKRAELRAQAARDPRAARWAAARAVAGIALVASIALPFGLLWALVGATLVGSTLLFARDAANAAIERPSLLLRARPKWEGTTRTNWSIEADDPLAVAGRLAAELDEMLGEPLTAFVDDGEEGTTRRQAFAAAGDGVADRPSISAWAVRGAPRLAAVGDVEGVWLRVDRSPDGPPTVTVLANEGAATDALTQAAWRA